MDFTQPNPANYRLPFTMNEFNGMPYRRLGRSGLQTAAIGLGTWKFGYPSTGDGSRIDEPAALRILDRAVELGVAFWDTANRYSDSSGNSERIIGKWFKSNPDQRRNVVLATKVYGGMDGRTPNHCGSSRGNILDAVDACRRRLQLDYIDLLYLHAFDGGTPVEETLSAVEDLVYRGWIRYFGVSNFALDQIKTYQAAERQFSCRTRMTVVQNKFDILNGETPRNAGVLDYAAAGELSFVAYSPLAKGLLTERYLDPTRSGPGDRLYDEGTLAKDATPAALQKIRALHSLAQAAGLTVEQLVLTYMLTMPGMGPCIPSVSSVAQLESNAAAAKTALTAEQRAAVCAAVSMTKTAGS